MAPISSRISLTNNCFQAAQRINGVSNSYIYDRFKKIQIIKEPFSHFICDNFFPADYYKRITDNRIGWDQAECIDSMGRSSGSPDRFIVPLNRKRVKTLPPDIRPFWTDFIKAVFGLTLPYMPLQGLEEASILPEALYSKDRKNYQ